MKMRKMCYLLSMAVIFIGCRRTDCSESEFDFDKLNRQAANEYLVPIKPGYVEGNPYWNVFAKKFIYAPAFDFKSVDNAKSYVYKLKQGDREWSFVADTPNAPLSEIWNDIPVGQVKLNVVAVNENGDSLRVSGQRSFYRDFPFSGPYRGPARDYREAALKGLYFAHNIKAIQHWVNNKLPDMSFENTTVQ